MDIPGYTYIAHKIVERFGKYECRFTVKPPGDVDINDVIPIDTSNPEESVLVDRISKRLAIWKAAKDEDALYSRVFDNIGPEIKEALVWIVLRIRTNPGATLIQARNAWNATWADSLFDFDRLVTHLQRILGDITWNEFKAFVINNKFRGVD